MSFLLTWPSRSKVTRKEYFPVARRRHCTSKGMIGASSQLRSMGGLLRRSRTLLICSTVGSFCARFSLLKPPFTNSPLPSAYA